LRRSKPFRRLLGISKSEVHIVNNTVILVLAVFAVVVIAGFAIWAMQRRRSRELRQRFGPEYERAVGSAHDKRKAEADLRERQDRVDALEIRPLDPAARDRFSERWREVQAMFVDDPGSAVDQADTLIEEVMRARGYPVGDFEQRAADVSVNHPQVVDHYRTAHAIATRRRSGDGATEQLRQAFVHYRALFADLLETAEPDSEPATTETRRTASAADERQVAATTDAATSEAATTEARAQVREDTASRVEPETEQPVEPARRS
jgi:hypothetical protein